MKVPNEYVTRDACEGVQPEQGIKRELSLGEVISKTFELYRRDFMRYFALFAVVGVIIGVVTALVQRALVLPTPPLNPTPQEFFNYFSRLIAYLVPLVASILFAYIVFFPIAQGSAIKQASDRIEHGKADLGASIRFAVSKLIWIWALSLLVGIIVFLGFIALVVPGIILAIMFSLAFPVLLIENRGVLDSMGRSRKLVGQRWLKTFATFLVLGVIVLVASIITSAVSGLFGVASPVVNGILSASYQPLLPLLLAVYYHSNVARIGSPPAGQIPTGSTVQAGMKFCPNCGTQLPSSASFCSRCGAKQPA